MRFRQWLSLVPERHVGIPVDEVPDVDAYNEDRFPKALVVWCSKQRDVVSATVLARYNQFVDYQRSRPMQISSEVAEQLADIMYLLHASVEDGERWQNEERGETTPLTWEIRCSIQTQALRDALYHLRAAVQ